MRTSSMSSGTLLASRGPAAPPAQPAVSSSGSGASSAAPPLHDPAPPSPWPSLANNNNNSLLGQLPAAPAALKSVGGPVGHLPPPISAIGKPSSMAAAGAPSPTPLPYHNSHHRIAPGAPLPPQAPIQQQQQQLPTPTTPGPPAPQQQQQQPFAAYAASLSRPQSAAQGRFNGQPFDPAAGALPPPLNDQEFPSLANARASPTPHATQLSAPSLGAALINPNLFGTKDFNSLKLPYASLIRTVESTAYGQQPEFNLQSEDFPALPGAIQNGNGRSSSAQPGDQPAAQLDADALINGLGENGKGKEGIQTGPNVSGLVTNIPPGMLTDQYGIAGMLSFLRTIENEPTIVSMALGYDLTNLGLNLNSTERNLYLTFGGPWAEAPCRVQDLDVKVPEEYLTNAVIREKLPQIKMNKLSEDVLFYMFYNCPGQVYQLAAACELYHRDWRFHKKEAVWLTRTAYHGVKEQTVEYEKGQYHIFDPIQWRKIPKEMTLEYKMLENRPQGQGQSALLGAASTSNPSVNSGVGPGAPNAPLPPGAASSQMPPFSK